MHRLFNQNWKPKKMSKTKTCELKGRCQVVFPKFTIMKESYGWHIFYNVGDMEMLHNCTCNTIDEVANIVKIIENFEDGLRRNHMNLIYFAPEAQKNARN